MVTTVKQEQPAILLKIAATIIASGVLIGASTNAVNGMVSPVYFRNVMRWENVENIWRASIAQGILEGMFYGVLFSLVFIVVFYTVTRMHCTYEFILRHLLIIAIAIYACWMFGGLFSIGLAFFSPEFFRSNFRGVPEELNDLINYAWVGGSISGAQLGGLLALVIGSIWFTIRWRRLCE